ncbi:MAG TPA: hypothetical protein VHI50_14285 [Micromonosporaceae bacterium]|nr:hypothetical protein [Micromonosporaceae bacterium]
MEALWDSLPESLRVGVDDLVLHDLWIQAIAAVAQAGLQPQPELLRCQDLAQWRYRKLHDRIQSEPEQPRDVETLLGRVAGIGWAPDAIEAVWDGDTHGWLVLLVAVRENPRTESTLAIVRHGGDLRVFNGQVPPWSEAEEATHLGRALAERLRVPFYFASPEEPDVDVPRWWDVHRP